MRTDQEIKEYIEKNGSMFGFTAEVLVGYLSFEAAKPLLKEEYVAKVERQEAVNYWATHAGL